MADHSPKKTPSPAIAGDGAAEHSWDDIDEYEGHPQHEEPGPVDYYSPLVLMAVGVAVLIPSLQLGIGSFADPGPGLWPFLNVLAVLLLCPVILFQRHHFKPPARDGLLRVLGVVAPLLLFVPLYDWAGLIGAGAPALLVITKFVGGMKWIPAIILSVVTPVAVYVLFAVLLGVNFRPF